MNKIKTLSDEIINQIAAGEVIERPASVIKELVENSIDAKSTFIEVEIEDYGKKLISVKDNGSGILKDDLEFAPLRHSTSKISNFEDLYDINSMGFRGEALASIFSISNAKIVSKVEGKEAFEISSLDGVVKESAFQKGTKVEVKDIFYNTPARLKYLKSDNMELKAILDIFKRFEIVYFDIKLVLKHNGKVLVNKAAFKSYFENLRFIFGNELKDNLIEFKNDINGIKVFGFLGKPASLSYRIAKNQYFFVNNRFVKSKLLKKGVYEGFSSNLMEGRHPFFTIFIDIDPEIIDVNVHPTKEEIKFENELEIFEAIRKSVKEVFEFEESFKEFEREAKGLKDDLRDVKDFQKDLNLNVTKSAQNKGFKPKIEKEYFTEDVQKSFEVKEDEVEYKKEEVKFETPKISSGSPNREAQKIDFDEENEDIEEYGPLFEVLKDYRIVGQVNKTFVILETPKEMIVVDQHVAEEKFYYELFKNRNEGENIKTQVLLKPEMIEFTQSDMLLFKENKAFLEKLGFVVEEFGENTILVREVPIDINKNEISPKLIEDIIGEVSLDNKFVLLEENRLERLASMSCKASIKAGDEMTNPEIVRMIENLKRLKEPFNCPHGRPIMLRYKFSELDRKFGRVM